MLTLPRLSLPLLTLALASTASAQVTTWCTEATGSEQVPPVSTSATADAVFTLDESTNLFTWHITHQGLTGSHNATHIHGPAAIGQNAGVQINLGTGNPVTGSTFISAQQVADLKAGLWYMNIHTSGFPGGEVRGQVDDICIETLCTAFGNSFDASGARLEVGGDLVAANNALTLTGTGVPPGQFGLLLIGQGTVAANVSQGQLCLNGAPIGRFTSQVLTADGAGVMGPFTPDILSLPNPPGGTVMAGETWGFQTWFRDGSASNFTDAMSVTFQ